MKAGCMSKRKTLEDRIEHRNKKASWTVRGHIADELKRLEMQIRKLYHKNADTSFLHGQNTAINIILGEIREARR